MKTQKEEHRYMFPNAMAHMMKNVDMRVQYEASLMSMALLLLGMILMSIYSAIYVTQGLIFKILLLFNLAAGFIFMSSFLVTTYQQYVSYMSVMQIQDINIKKNRKNQSLFFFGLIFIVVSCLPFFISIADLPVFVTTYKWYIQGGVALLGLILIALALKKKKVKTNADLNSLMNIERQNLQQKFPTTPVSSDDPNSKFMELISSLKNNGEKFYKNEQQKNNEQKINEDKTIDPKKKEKIKLLIKALQERLADIEMIKNNVRRY